MRIPYAADGVEGLTHFIRQSPRDQLQLAVVRAFQDGPYETSLRSCLWRDLGREPSNRLLSLRRLRTVHQANFPTRHVFRLSMWVKTDTPSLSCSRLTMSR